MKYEMVIENATNGYILDKEDNRIVVLCSTKRPDLGFEKIKDLVELANRTKENEPTSHSEKDIVENCIALMESVHQNMLEYMEFMGFEYDKEDEEEIPQFRYSYMGIVQHLLLCRTTHGGGTSTREKCEKLGFDSYGEVIIGEYDEDGKE